MKMRGKAAASGKALWAVCIACFLAGSFFRGWPFAFLNNNQQIPINYSNHITKLADEVTSDCDHDKNKPLVVHRYRDVKLIGGKSLDVMGEVLRTHQAIQSLDKTISALEKELEVARASHIDGKYSLGIASNQSLRKAFAVIGINTAFSNKKRREAVRASWMPTGEELRRIEKEKGIVIRFVIGHSAKPGGVLDKGIDAEDAEHQDFLRLNLIEGYKKLSTKTRTYFSTAFSIWDAEFYVKVDDDVHVNLGTLVNTLANQKSKPRIYIGCMKSGPVLYQKGMKYHEPEYWKFGEEGNNYFMHATGQIYAISKDLAAYISFNSPILHTYANEDVSLGSWFIGLDVEHVDDRSMCCGTPPDCEWKAKEGSVCVASFDWPCSGICNAVERMKEVHNCCGERDGAVWNVDLWRHSIAS